MIYAAMTAVCLSFLVAAAELMSKFRDEPYAIFKHPATWLYLVFNGLLALSCLFILVKTAMFGVSEADYVKAGLTAGLGSVVIMRSKFLKLTIGDKETAIGPEIIVNVFLETLETKIDRERGLHRKKLVERQMSDINFFKARRYVETVLTTALQTKSKESIDKLMNAINDIAVSELDDIDKSLALGFVILDFTGEEFLREIFNDSNRQRFV